MAPQKAYVALLKQRGLYSYEIEMIYILMLFNTQGVCSIGKCFDLCDSPLDANNFLESAHR